ARARESAALLSAARMAFLPTLDLDASTTRSSTGISGGGNNNNNGTGTFNTGDNDNNTGSGTGSNSRSSSRSRITTQHSIGATSVWEIDLWGRLRHNARAITADAQSAAAEVEVTRLSLQSQAAQTYFSLRSVDAQRALLDRQIKNYERSLEITRNRYEQGVASRGDVAQAEVQLASTRASAIETGVQRATLEHALAVLVGQAPAAFGLGKENLSATVPRVPPVVPSRLLERRPDIASAERQVAAANERIGAAKAAFFPTISLGATGGWRGMGKLLTMPTRYWSLGPDLAQPILDGGQRIAAKAQADATYDATVANYRQVVLTALQEVEDSLATLRILAQEAVVQEQAVRAATENERIALNAYTAGTDTYLNVAIAQASSLNAQRNALDIQARRLNATVALITALGGMW
ncbi:MAG: efflux transporter outer membrane subunit, partial [Verrucomicrobiaceae bacterium]